MPSRLSSLFLLLLALSLPTPRAVAADTAFAAGIATFAYGENTSLEATAYEYIATHHDDPAALRALSAAAADAGARATKPDGRAVAAWIIGLSGDDAQLPFLQKLLSSKENFPDAASAITQLRTLAAAAALADACNQETAPLRRLALVTALGLTRLPDAAAPLAKLAGDTDPAFAAAARAALADLQTPDACAALAALPPAVAAPEQITAARTLATLGQTAAAAALAGKLVADTALPPVTRAAAASVIAEHDLPGAPELLATFADAKDPALQNLAYDHFAKLPAPVRQKLLARLQSAATAAHNLAPATLQRVITVIPAIPASDALPFISAKNKAVRDAAQRRVALDPDRASFDLILAGHLAAAADNPGESAALLAAMSRQADIWVTAALSAAKTSNDQVKLCELVKRRAAPAAAPAVRPLLAAADPKVRAAAYAAIGATGLDNASDALDLLFTAPPAHLRDAVNAARSSYRRAPDRKAFANALVDALDRAAARPQIRDFLLTFASESGTSVALAALWKIYDNPDAGVADGVPADAGRLAVLRALAKWPDETPLDRLAEIAANVAAPANLRALALRDYFDILARATDATVPERLRHANRALALAQTDQDRRAVLALAAAIPDPKARDILDTIGRQPELKTDYEAAKKAYHDLMKTAQKAPVPDAIVNDD